MPPFESTAQHEDLNSALTALRELILRMASISQRNLSLAMQGLIDRNTECCNMAIADDDEVDLLEVQTDQQCTEILDVYRPRETDMRRVLAGMRIANNLERVSDQAVNIATRARKLNKRLAIPETAMVQPLYDLASSLLHESITAYIDGNSMRADQLSGRDQALDDFYTTFMSRMTARTESNPDRLKSYIHLMFIARFLERVGDHAVNIGEETLFVVGGADIAHSRGALRPLSRAGQTADDLGTADIAAFNQ